MTRETKLNYAISGATILVLLLSFFFRAYNLGYSEFQGDEANTLDFMFSKMPFSTFLLSQTKGPGQYVLVYLIGLFYKNLNYLELAMRIPFAIAGILTTLISYLYIKKIYSRTATLAATMLVGFSGLLIAFGRIAQYQAFVMLFSILTALAVHKYVTENKKITWIAVSAVFSAAALLFHYDALSFILPVFMYLVLSKKYKVSALYLFLTGAICSVYFIPFILNPSFSETISYLWGKRIQTGNEEAASQTLTIFAIYHSKEFMLLMIIGLVLWVKTLFSKINTLSKSILLVSILLLLVKFGLGESYFKITYFSTIVAWGLLFILLVKNRVLSQIELWFMVAFLAYGLIIKFPLTHIYTFFIPLLIIAGSSLIQLKKYVWIAILVVFVSAVSFNYEAFVNTEREYPWQTKSYMFGPMYSKVAENTFVKGIFGFPYNRGWKEIRTNLTQYSKDHPVATYSTNEKVSIADFYLNYDQPGTYVFDVGNPDLFILIKRPQSLVNTLKIKGTPVYTGTEYQIYPKGLYKTRN